MLEPYSRSLLLDLLRPPEGYRFDCGIGTTYSLDLNSLLTAPFAFSYFDASQNEGGPKPDSLAALSSLREYAERLTVFCQVDKIAIPRSRYLQLAYLEQSVIGCQSPRGGAFHPKVWALRFAGTDGQIFYRFLCLTRNLTFDRSWDTALALEGPLVARKNSIAANRPLGDFISALPKMAVRQPLPRHIQERIDRLQDEVRRVDFSVPEGFNEYRFWPIGLANRRDWPFGDTGRRMLVISPFVSRGRLEKLVEQRENNVLVSTIPCLSAIGGPPRGYEKTYVLDDKATPEPSTSNADSEDDASGSGVLAAGLHAKCYIADDGWDAHVWTGSANATDAAFERNVEFLVELIGKKSVFGIDSVMLHEKGTTRLIDFLQQAPRTWEPVVIDEVEKQLTRLTREATERLVSASLTAFVKTAEQGDRFDVALRAGCWAPANQAHEVQVLAWPVTLPEDSHRRELTTNRADAVVFPGLSYEALTTFYAFEIRAELANRVKRERFVLNLPAEGLPTDRSERLLRIMLRDRNRFVRFLLLLLSDAEGPIPANGGQDEGVDGGGDVQRQLGSGEALLESLVRALDRSPQRLDQVDRLVSDLASTPEGLSLLPEGFLSVWQPIKAARERMQNGTVTATS